MGVYIEGVFDIKVNNEVYKVESNLDDANCFKFKIFTACEYMFTLDLDENGSWKMENDVIPIDPSLINEIGYAIEQHNL